jgi:hypothetical protein
MHADAQLGTGVLAWEAGAEALEMTERSKMADWVDDWAALASVEM